MSFRCKRAVYDYCTGSGWIETGNDRVGHADIVMSPNGYPHRVVAFEPRQDSEHAVADPTAPLSPEQFDRQASTQREAGSSQSA